MKRLYSLLAVLTVLLTTATAQTDSITTGQPADSTLLLPWPQNVQARLDSLTRLPLMETTQLGLMVFDLTADSALFQKGARQMLRPASCMKLVTAITALDRLGGRYEFQTRLYHDGTLTDGILNGNIYCVGGFDPALTADDVAVMAESVRARGIDSISGNIVADCTMKDVLDYGEGWCWDDDNPMLIPLTIGRKNTFTETLLAKLKAQGIRAGAAQTTTGMLPTGARFVSSYRHTMDDILGPMMKESDNFYAEAMLYQTAASTGRRPAKVADARAVTQQLVRKLGLGGNRYRIADGSGLSLYNYVSAELLVTLLRYAYHHETIYDHLLPALPVAGTDGTLKSRMKGTDTAGNVCAKTGTLTGISSLAGYLTAANGHQLCFAIINQGVMRNQDGRQFQDAVCKSLCSE